MRFEIWIVPIIGELVFRKNIGRPAVHLMAVGQPFVGRITGIISIDVPPVRAVAWDFRDITHHWLDHIWVRHGVVI